MPGFRDECAVFGIWGDPEAAYMTFLGLYAQQHRGQESTGIVSLYEGQHIDRKGLGLVADVYTEDVLSHLKGDVAIGHNRYSTTGKNLLSNAQPLTAKLSSGPVAVAHNGNIVNAEEIRKELTADGAIFQGTNDTEVVLHVLARNRGSDIFSGLKAASQKLQGAYSLVILSHDALYAMRDAHGFRPLSLGRRKLENGRHSTVIASETCAFDLIGAEFVREVEPGEILKISDKGEESVRFAKPLAETSHCVFEHVYFARPDSNVFGRSVYQSRRRMGEVLAHENPVDADIVIPVPDSGVPAAIGYSHASRIPFEMGIIRNHYIGRTFIQPAQSIRNLGVKIKLNPQSHLLKGKRVIVVDDSLVRGTTSQKIIRLVRQAGAKEVHFRIASPPTTGSCFYGVDTPKKSQLIAAHQSAEDIRKFIDADSLSYLSIEGMMKAVGGTKSQFCAACFDGRYPTELYGLDHET